ncbi:type II toxin-antitoxin system Phd/YefM family antitoxin [Pusillimonas sp.]|uniref:type II toxin-antitoxin system Phd/YefM family antitoxin n=1 Tax=Pusillimonas sp. TaxID=3040095 RepID=UPI0037C8EF11
MRAVSLTKAKSILPKLIRSVEKGHDTAIIILRNGKPAAQIVPIEPIPTHQRFGVAKSKIRTIEPTDPDDPEIVQLFTGPN